MMYTMVYYYLLQEKKNSTKNDAGFYTHVIVTGGTGAASSVTSVLRFRGSPGLRCFFSLGAQGSGLGSAGRSSACFSSVCSFTARLDANYLHVAISCVRTLIFVLQS